MVSVCVARHGAYPFSVGTFPAADTVVGVPAAVSGDVPGRQIIASYCGSTCSILCFHQQRTKP